MLTGAANRLDRLGSRHAFSLWNAQRMLNDRESNLHWECTKGRVALLTSKAISMSGTIQSQAATEGINLLVCPEGFLPGCYFPNISAATAPETEAFVLGLQESLAGTRLQLSLGF